MKQWAERLFYKIVWRLVWIFYPRYTIEGLENLPEEPAIVVGNHSQAHGPIFSELYFPGKRSIWCAGQMMSAKEVPDYTYHDFWDEKPAFLHPLFRLVSYIIALPISAVMRCGDTIAVYHDTRVISTFRATIRKLREGSHIIIFPECKKGYNQILCAFQENFIDVAKLYYKKTGKEVCFVPMYLAPRLRKAFFGKPIRYDSTRPIAEERQRICRELMESITAIAVSQPEHIVVPYPNIPKKDYRTNLSTEAILHDETNG